MRRVTRAGASYRELDTAVMDEVGYLAAMNIEREPHPQPSSNTF